MSKFYRLWFPLGAALFVLWTGMWLVNAPTTSAQPNPGVEAALIVNELADELNDDGDCSLREAIQAANTNTAADACGSGDVLSDSITFAVIGTINLTEQLSVDAGGPLEIDGAGAVSISGGSSVGIFSVNPGAELTLQNLVLINGRAGTGGGIYNNGTLTLTGSTLSGSHAINSGGGIYSAYGGTMSITNSTLSGNYAADGGGIENWGRMNITGSTLSGNIAEFAGGINNLGTLNITESILSGNGAFNGGGILNQSTITITNSTLSGNSATNVGGGIENYSGMLTITNSTLSGNSAGYGGGIENMSSMNITGSTLSGNSAGASGGGISNGWMMTITNSTLSGNSAGSHGGGIFNYSTLTIMDSTLSGNSAYGGGGIDNYSGTLTITNSIVANSPSGGECTASSPITDNGHNISSDDTCGFDPANGSLPNTNPLLGVLADNGGPTWTHALLEGSPAIDAGDDAQCPASDQRGVHRPLDGNRDGLAVCDIGSFEYFLSITYLPLVVKE
jgi:CSLREA domain-containing protein